jgi:spectinomycin phosphotransferase
MLEKPAIEDAEILHHLELDYGLHVVQITFLPLGADRFTAVYRAEEEDGTQHFVKLRGGGFDRISVLLPKFLSDRGIGHILAPRPTKAGQLWAVLGAFKLMVYPFVEGSDAYQVPLLDRHWVELGTILRAVHSAVLPPALARDIRREDYSPQARKAIRSFLAGSSMADARHSERKKLSPPGASALREGRSDHHLGGRWGLPPRVLVAVLRHQTMAARNHEFPSGTWGDAHKDPIAGQLSAFLQARRDQILDLAERAERLAHTLQAETPASVLCHSDIHAGNILIDAGGAFYLVDWDEPILAPKERDLMSVGAGLMGETRTPQEEEGLFYQGYGSTKVDPRALAYYRYERIIQDIAIFSEQILLADRGRRDRELSLRHLTSHFLPGGTLELAYRSEGVIPRASV